MANTDDTPGSLVPKDGELWFSDKFKVDPVVLEDYGADVSVVIDTPIPLGGPVLPDHPPGEPLGDAHGLHQMVRGSPASLRAQKFTSDDGAGVGRRGVTRKFPGRCWCLPQDLSASPADITTQSVVSSIRTV